MVFLTVCTFADHREVFSPVVESEIDETLIEIIEADKECIFYSGGMGDSDKKYESAVRGTRRKYPEQSIRLVRVPPYLTHEINRDKEYFESYHGDIVVPMESMGVRYKMAIRKRNHWMVDQADKMLAYIYRDPGGTLDAMRYAYRMGEPVLDFAVKEWNRIFDTISVGGYSMIKIETR